MSLFHYPPAAPVDPVSLSTGADGFYYNCQSLSNMRQDNLDTAAVVGQPVGMFFDNWISNALGANIVTNGDFPTTTTGWTGNGATLSVVSARLRVTTTSTAAGRAFQSLTTVVGATYKCTVDLVANADGAELSVGTANNNNLLFLKTIAAGVTGSFTFYFIASTTTSFIQLKTNTTAVGKTTDWDNVVVKNIAGRHLIQQTSTLRPILRQDALGYYYLEPDGVDDFLLGGLSYTLQMPHYLACLFRRKDTTSPTVFGVQKNTTNYHRFGLTTSNRLTARLREGTIGETVAVDINNASPVDRIAVHDSLAVVGVNDIGINRRIPEVIANSWLVGTQITLCAPGIFVNGTGVSAQTNHFYVGLGMAQDPGASRAGIRAFIANLAGAD